MAASSRAVVVVRGLRGNPQENWRIVTRDKPKASPGHVVVRMTLRPVNPSDTAPSTHLVGHLAGKEVAIGSEGVGIVSEVGEGVTKVQVGQRVVPSFLKQFYANGNGSWQDYVEVTDEEIFLIPDSIPDEVAAQFIINPWTLYGLLKEQEVPEGEYLLQTAAGSVLGRMVIQLAKHWGIKTINVVRRDDVKEDLKSLGADEVINSTNEDIVARVKEITGGKGAYGAIDAVGGILTKDVVASVRDGGKVFIYGILGTGHTGVADATVGIFDFGRVNIRFWSLFRFLKTPKQTQEVANEVAKLLHERAITPLSGKKFKLENFEQAVLEVNKVGRGGKVMLVS